MANASRSSGLAVGRYEEYSASLLRMNARFTTRVPLFTRERRSSPEAAATVSGEGPDTAFGCCREAASSAGSHWLSRAWAITG
ncbi:hypothetical protein [Streptomyces sp. NPDC051577]|uniref:hypothetical protein n=1 Tax=Streptomyces sp. NPDC051577 TaxID=3155166 RepID=UPI003444BB54